MSAPYPLVRNFSACSTRAGVRTSPSRSGSSPSSMSRRLMRSFTCVLYIAVFASPLTAFNHEVHDGHQAWHVMTSCPSCASWFSAQTSGAVASQGDPDALYRDRADFARARQAADIWSARLAANPRDFESAWKLARAYYWLGTQGPAAERRTALERGTEAGRRASMIDPSRPEGYFWMAANMGTLAESYGVRQ